VLEGEPMALPTSLREINERVTKAGEDLKETYNQLRRGGAPRTSKPTSSSPGKRGQLETTELLIPIIPDSPQSGIARGFAEVNRQPRQTEVTQVTPQEALEMIVNEPAIVITPELMEVINDPTMMMTRSGELTRRMSNDLSRQFELQNVLPRKKRKVSKYQREFGRQLKMLKKKFPRTPITKLMKRAHAATRKALKKK
jgi:hypothetical protein